MTQKVEEQGKTLSEIVIRLMREKNRPVTSREIADELGLNYLSVNRTLGWLEKKGLVKVEYKTKRVITPYGKYVKPIFGTYKYSLKD